MSDIRARGGGGAILVQQSAGSTAPVSVQAGISRHPCARTRQCDGDHRRAKLEQRRFGLIARTSAAANNDPVVGTAEGGIDVTSAALTATNIGINAFGPRASVTANSGTASVAADSTTAIPAQATNGGDVAVTSGVATSGAVRLIANGAGGAVTANITGALASTSGTGLFIDPPGAVVVNVATGASIAGGLNGINTTGATNAITNGGSIFSTGAGTATLDGVNSLRSTDALTLAGPLSGAGSIVKQGAGQLDLSGSNRRVAELAGGSREDGTRLRRQNSRARTEIKLVGGHVGDALGAVSVVIGGDYAWHDIDTSRTPGVAGLAAGATSSAKAHTIQGYGEIGYGVEYGGFTAVPVARFSYVHIVSDALTESGGLGALTVARDERDYKFGSAGLRLSGEAPVASGVTFLPRATISYTRGWDIGGGRTLAFAGAGIGRASPIGEGQGVCRAFCSEPAMRRASVRGVRRMLSAISAFIAPETLTAVLPRSAARPSRTTASGPLASRVNSAMSAMPARSANSVWVGPGHKAATRTPCGRTSSCRASEKLSTNALDA